MSTLPKQNHNWGQVDQVEENFSHNETPAVEPMVQPETSDSETKGQRGRPKGVRSAKVIQSEIDYKLGQIEKQTSRLESFQEKMDLCKSKIETFENDIAELKSQLDTAE